MFTTKQTTERFGKELESQQEERELITILLFLELIPKNMEGGSGPTIMESKTSFCALSVSAVQSITLN